MGWRLQMVSALPAWFKVRPAPDSLSLGPSRERPVSRPPVSRPPIYRQSGAFSFPNNLWIHQPVAHLLYCSGQPPEVHFLCRNKADETGQQTREPPGGD
jgi:hypothetical protein